MCFYSMFLVSSNREIAGKAYAVITASRRWTGGQRVGNVPKLMSGIGTRREFVRDVIALRRLRGVCRGNRCCIFKGEAMTENLSLLQFIRNPVMQCFPSAKRWFPMSDRPCCSCSNRFHCVNPDPRSQLIEACSCALFRRIRHAGTT